ncbi:pyrroline-5-carboxylate reductase dimerization domain-containing protein [Sphingomonas sp. RT2P30]|uniref:pyrroline-5-carboxylate reductase family protein n=1 Tax=Parasphingomonas halimpatiens TaxID=3096162 RepID=UPI002FC8E67C
MTGPRLWLIGCGNMGGAMLRRWIDSGVVAADAVDVVNRCDRALPAGVRQARALPDGPLPDIVMLAMKPQQLDEIAAAHAARLAGVPVLVSILAGVEEPALAARFDAGAIFRAMPNLPVAIGKGVVALSSASADAAARDAIASLMAPLGLVEWIGDSRLFDTVTALAGSGPAFLYRFIDALADAGGALGLPADQSARFALATVEGAALLAAAADVSPGVLADRVASPGGSTRAGLNVLDREEGLAALLAETLAASERRNAEMAASAR